MCKLDELYAFYQASPHEGDGFDDLFKDVRSYANGLVRRAFSGGDDDLVQTIVIAVWQSLPRFSETRSTFRTFVHTIAGKKIADEFRKRYRTPSSVEIEVLDQIADSECADYMPSKSRMCALNALSQEDQSTIKTFVVYQDFAEASTELGISPKALRSRIERIKIKLSNREKVAVVSE